MAYQPITLMSMTLIAMVNLNVTFAEGMTGTAANNQSTVERGSTNDAGKMTIIDQGGNLKVIEKKPEMQNLPKRRENNMPTAPEPINQPSPRQPAEPLSPEPQNAMPASPQSMPQPHPLPETPTLPQPMPTPSLNQSNEIPK